MKMNRKIYPEGYVFKVGTVFREDRTEWVITKVNQHTYEWKYLGEYGGGTTWNHRRALSTVNESGILVKEPDPVKYDESVLEGL